MIVGCFIAFNENKITKKQICDCFTHPEKGKSRFSNPENTAKLLQKACRDSYRLDKSLYDPLNVTIAASFNCISSLEKQIKELDKAILKAVKGLSSNEYQCLLSIKGIGPVFAARYYC